MRPPVAVLDACVLYPAPLRDLWMYLAVNGAFHPRWSEGIHDEWIRNLLAKRSDLSRPQLERTRSLMDRHVPDALVRDYELLITNITLPDANDRHVVAAAIAASADSIVTFNLADFPVVALLPHGLVAVDPDDFLVSLLDQNETAFLTAVRGQRAGLTRPSKTVQEFLRTLEQQKLPKLVQRLDRYISRL